MLHEESVRWFGIAEKPKKTAPGVAFTNRHQKRINSLAKERRVLRKKLKKATTDIEKNGFEALFKNVVS